MHLELKLQIACLTTAMALCTTIGLHAQDQAETPEAVTQTTPAIEQATRKMWYGLDKHNWEIVERALMEGADILSYNDYNNTILHQLAICSSSQLLLNKICVSQTGKEIINHKNARGQTPLHQASLHGNKAGVVILLSEGADPLIVDNRRETPLQTAEASLTETEEALKKSEEYGDESNIRRLSKKCEDLRAIIDLLGKAEQQFLW